MTKRISRATGLMLRLTTADGIAESVDNIIAYGHRAQDVRDALCGCEWSAEAVSRALDACRPMLYAHDWVAIRTAPRHVAVEGCDSFGNTHVLYVRLRDNEPDMFEGTSLRVSLTNRSRVALSLSNILSRGCSVACFENRLYEVAGTWTAEAFASAMNRAHRDGTTYDRDWRPVCTHDDKCVVAGRDAWGNEHILVISRG
jgi:hypothetical protein